MFKKIHVVVAVSALFLTACGQSNTSSVESAAPTVAGTSWCHLYADATPILVVAIAAASPAAV